MNRLISLSRIIVTAAVIIASAAPLAITPWLIYPFVTGKTFLFELMALVALPFWVALLLLDPGARPRRHPLVWVLIVQMFVLILAGIFGSDPGQSFWGRDERMMGAITLLSLLALFGMALSVFTDRKSWMKFFAVVLALAWINILWGLAEHFFPAFWKDFRGGSMRVVGLIGNPIFYGGLMMGTAGLAALLIPETKSRLMRVFLIVTAAAAVLVTLYSGTRGAELGLFGGLAAALVFIGIASRKKELRIGAIAGIVGIAAVLVFFFIFRDAAFLKPVRELRRLGSAFSLTDTTAVQRFRLWQVAANGALARPLLGWGPENFDYLFDQHFDPRFLSFSLRETFADRPHNAFIEAATDAGALGLLTFLAVRAVFLMSVLRLRKGGASLWSCALMVGYLAAMDIYLLFAFETVPTLWISLIVFAWLIFKTSAAPKGEVYQRQAKTIVPVAAALSLVLIIAAVIRPAMAFTSFHNSVVADPKSQFEKWKSNLEDAADLSQPYQDSMRYRAGAAIFGAVGDQLVPEDRVDEILELGIKYLKQAVLNRPKDYASRFTLGNLLLLSAINGQNERFAEAEKEFLRAAELSPRRQSTFIQLGNLKVVSGDPTVAVSYYQKAVDLDPGVGEPHWYLGRGLLKAGDSAAAAEEFSRAWELGYRPKIKNEIREAASLLFSQGRSDFTVLLYERAVDLFSDDPELWAEMAAAYAAAGDAEKARAAVRRAVELDPSFAAEAETFLNLLDSGALFSPSEGE